MSLALLFPGQGSQEVGMGRALALEFEEAARTFREADEVLGLPLSRIMWEGPEDELVQTRNAQPALLTHSVAVTRVMGPRLRSASMAAGHSLGEFSAHVAAGTLSFGDALQAVRRRGDLMFEAGEARPGTMAAILGMEDDEVARLCERVSTEESVVVTANVNSPGQIVISGDLDAVERAMEQAGEAGARRVVPLNVSGAFHSPLMEPAREGLRSHLQGISFHRPAFPIISNVTAEPVTEAEEARRLLVDQLTSPVLWASSVSGMVEAGVSRFVEIGPGSVLRGLNRRIAREIPTASVGMPSEVRAWHEESEK